ncbi:unnamed protein product, partial [Colletotrichum noveboracense]
MASTEGQEYTAKEVAAHREANDCWMVIRGEEAFDNAGHSEDASEIMAEFRVGKLKGANKRN